MLTRLQRLGLRRGFGGNKTWLYIGITAWGLRSLQRMAQRKPDVLLVEELKPGRRIIISNDRPTVDVAPAANGAASRSTGRKGRRRSRAAG